MKRGEVTTARISRKSLIKLNECCKKRGMTHVEFFDAFFESVHDKKWQKFYDALPLPSNYIKPLEFVKIKKKYTKKDGS